MKEKYVRDILFDKLVKLIRTMRSKQLLSDSAQFDQFIKNAEKEQNHPYFALLKMLFSDPKFAIFNTKENIAVILNWAKSEDFEGAIPFIELGMILAIPDLRAEHLGLAVMPEINRPMGQNPVSILDILADSTEQVLFRIFGPLVVFSGFNDISLDKRIIDAALFHLIDYSHLEKETASLFPKHTQKIYELLFNDRQYLINLLRLKAGIVVHNDMVIIDPELEKTKEMRERVFEALLYQKYRINGQLLLDILYQLNTQDKENAMNLDDLEANKQVLDDLFTKLNLNDTILPLEKQDIEDSTAFHRYLYYALAVVGLISLLAGVMGLLILAAPTAIPLAVPAIILLDTLFASYTGLGSCALLAFAVLSRGSYLEEPFAAAPRVNVVESRTSLHGSFYRSPVNSELHTQQNLDPKSFN